MSYSGKHTVFAPILLIVIFILITAAGFLPENVIGINENPYLAVVVIQLLTYALPALFYCKVRGSALTSRMRLSLFRPSQILYIIYAAVFMLSGVFLISMLMYSVSPDSFQSSAVTGYAAFAMNDRFIDGAYLFVTFALLPALCEELLFRGVMTAEYEAGGASVAVVMSAVMFAMSHFSFARFPVYFFSGLVLGCVLYATRSVLAAVLIHTVNNAFVLFLEEYVLHIVDKQNVSLVLFAIILGALAIVSAMLMCWEAQSIYRAYADANTESPYAQAGKQSIFGRIAEAFFAPAFLCAVIFFIVIAIRNI